MPQRRDGVIEDPNCSSRLQLTRILQSVGIDKLALWFPTAHPWGRFDRQVHYQGMSLRIMARGRRAGVEFNPSRLVDPYGIELASTEQTIKVVPEVWDFVSGHVTPSEDLAMASVTRLDLARDFQGALDPAALLIGLSRLRRPHQNDPCFFTDKRTGEAKSLFVGTKEHGVRLYRKDLESPRSAEYGLIRWEYQGRPRPLRRFGITAYSDLMPEAIERIAENRWDWSRMSTSVTSPRCALSAIGSLDRSRPVKTRLFYDLTLLAETGEQPSHYVHRKELSDFIAEHGIVVDGRDVVVPHEPALAQRLDWETGTVVATLES